ncbi:hypothetical protein E5288_WYG012023 [Bos mutus]|uniref:Uncharacterized protein n=1 Tax=Bos mutus TaxID=72004 RepID=A0A6B0QUU8_9CETA|nr:hypothetical protein [Bos mutus]
MMLRRGPWPWRARLLPTPGTQGRAHPRPPMPQVSPSPGRGRRPKNFAWGKFGGRESPAEGHSLRFAGPSTRLRAREDPPASGRPGCGRGPGVHNRSHPREPRAAGTCAGASPRLSWDAGTVRLRPGGGGQHRYPGRQFVRV